MTDRVRCRTAEAREPIRACEEEVLQSIDLHIAEVWMPDLEYENYPFFVAVVPCLVFEAVVEGLYATFLPMSGLVTHTDAAVGRNNETEMRGEAHTHLAIVGYDLRTGFEH